MASKPKGTAPMADATETATKKRRAPQGPRKPSPLYAFVTVKDANGSPVAGAKVEMAASFRDPRKMAERFQSAATNGETLLVIAPEA